MGAGVLFSIMRGVGSPPQALPTLEGWCETAHGTTTRADSFFGGSSVGGPMFIWGFPKIRDTFLVVPLIWTIAFLGLYVGVPLFWETTIYELRERKPKATLLSLLSLCMLKALTQNSGAAGLVSSGYVLSFLPRVLLGRNR